MKKRQKEISFFLASNSTQMVSFQPKRENFTKEPIYYVSILLACFGIITFWRGLWNILDKYFIPSNFLVSNILSIIIGFCLIVIFADFTFFK